MSGFSIWHFLILLLFVGGPILAIVLDARARRRRRQPPS
jgi:hypothetical protein